MRTNIFGIHDENTITQFKEIEKNCVAAALMADGHYGYVMPVGGVAAYYDKVSVIGVGFDIACGNCAIKTDIKLSNLVGFNLQDSINNPSRIINNTTLNKLADDIARNISFGIGRANEADDAPTDNKLFDDDSWWIIPNIGKYRDDLKDKARRQLGTVGSGNHYVDIFVDEDDNIWVGVHFGSRGLGHTIASNFLAIGQGGTWGDKGKEIETLLNIYSSTGLEYWSLMSLAGEYAYAGREWVCRKVINILGGKELEMVHNHHNFAWKEQHIVNDDLETLIVVRKGATPAFPKQKGFIGGSMGDNAVIIEGTGISLDDEEGWWNATEDDRLLSGIQQTALYSTVHGAGRIMSRTHAAGKWDRKKKKYKTRGVISENMRDGWLNKQGVILRGGGLDEAPQVYRRLPDVLNAQKNTINILHTLKPLIVVMAKANEYDPYKD